MNAIEMKIAYLDRLMQADQERQEQRLRAFFKAMPSCIDFLDNLEKEQAMNGQDVYRTVDERKRVEAVRTDCENRVKHPGKFEGEKRYMPYFFDTWMVGLYDSDDGEVVTFNVTAEDRMYFPELKGRRVIKFRIRDDGFLCEVV